MNVSQSTTALLFRRVFPTRFERGTLNMANTNLLGKHRAKEYYVLTDKNEVYQTFRLMALANHEDLRHKNTRISPWNNQIMFFTFMFNSSEILFRWNYFLKEWLVCFCDWHADFTLSILRYRNILLGGKPPSWNKSLFFCISIPAPIASLNTRKLQYKTKTWNACFWSRQLGQMIWWEHQSGSIIYEVCISGYVQISVAFLLSLSLRHNGDLILHKSLRQWKIKQLQ